MSRAEPVIIHVPPLLPPASTTRSWWAVSTAIDREHTQEDHGHTQEDLVVVYIHIKKSRSPQHPPLPSIDRPEPRYYLRYLYGRMDGYKIYNKNYLLLFSSLVWWCCSSSSSASSVPLPLSAQDSVSNLPLHFLFLHTYYFVRMFLFMFPFFLRGRVVVHCCCSSSGNNEIM